MFKEFLPTLETQRLLLRKMTPNDAKDMYEYSSKREVTKYLSWTEHESEEYTRQYLKFLKSKYKKGEYLDWGITLKSTGKLIGTAGFTSLDQDNFKGEIGYVLNPEYSGNGYATEAVKAVLDYAFNNLCLNRIEARVMEGNLLSVKLLEKIGMTYEGKGEKELFVKGEFKSILHFSLLKERFKN